MPTRLSKNTAGNKKLRPLGRCFPIRSEADIKVFSDLRRVGALRILQATSFFFASAFLSAGFSSERRSWMGS